MTKRKGSPTLQLALTPELHERARTSDSGGCLVADAIKEQYPQYSSISVDMATVRFSDRAAGVRYTYLTPAVAQQAILFFDQGWDNPIEKVTLRRAVKVDPIIASPADKKRRTEARAARLEELEAKQAAGEELTREEKRAWTMIKNNKGLGPDRPSARGPAEPVVADGTVIVGGAPITQGRSQPHPNLLRGRNRHFGAKVADPGIAFREAVDEAVRQRLPDPL